MPDDRLKPCPFCGKNHAELQKSNDAWYVICQSCYCVGPIFNDERYLKKDIIKYWNTRNK